MQPYTIYPVKGKSAREYLLHLGCSLDTDEQLDVPDHLVVVPVSYRVSFPELIRSYNLADVAAAGLLGDYIAIASLKHVSDYTGHPYDLENVKVALASNEIF